MTSRPLWLSAFPKSGSTWLRFLLHHLIHGAPRCSRDVELSMPSIHSDNDDGLQQAMDQGGIVLTHKSFHSHTGRFPLVDAFIQVVRHPADVLLSDAHFFALTQLDVKLAKEDSSRRPEEVMQDLANLYLNNVLHKGKVPKQTRLGFGTWSENVSSWLNQRANRSCILIRYEDLKADPISQLERLCLFLGIERNREYLEFACNGASVESMKAMQEREIQEKIPGRFYDPRHALAYGAGLRFVRKGEVGQKLLLQGVAAQKLVAHFGPVMDCLGYTLSEGTAAAGPLSDEFSEIRPL